MSEIRICRTSSEASLFLMNAAAIFLLTIAVLFARMPERFARGYLWAEDAPIFIGQGFSMGARAIATPYAGYLNAIPRILVEMFSWFGKIPSTPHAFVWMTAIITAAACAYLYEIASRYFARVAAWVIGISPVIVPHNGEVWLTITNIQWVLAPLLLAMILDSSQRTDTNNLRTRCTVIALLSLTGPFSIIFSGAALLGLRRKLPWPQIIVLACAAIQLAAFAISPPNHPPVHATREYLHYHWVGAFFRYFVLDAVFPDRWVGGFGRAGFYVSFIVFSAFAAAVLTSPGKWRGACLIALAFAVALWILGVIRSDAPELPVRWSGTSARYTFVPLILCILALVITAEKSRVAVARYLSLLFLALIFMNSAARFSVPWYPYEINRQQDGSFFVLPGPGEPFHVIVKP